jgi:hypothetical protein
MDWRQVSFGPTHTTPTRNDLPYYVVITVRFYVLL